MEDGGIVADLPAVLFIWRLGEAAKVERVRRVW